MEIPGYRIERLVAEGGMSSVFLAVQESLGRRVALKLLKKFDSPQHATRFLEEARIIASLEHRNVITIHDVGAIGERHYIAMEYLEGGSLQDRIDQGIQPAAAIDLLEDIAVCLHFVHRKGIVHRDVKPSNILFHVDGTPKLTDFGIAVQRDRDQEQTMDGSAFGSPYYLSPEQAEGRALDGRSDIYALGIVFFQMLTGRKPYAARSHIETIVAHLSHPIPMLPDPLSRYQRLLERMIAKRPEDRIACAAHLVEEIRETRLQEGQRRIEARTHPQQRASDLITRLIGRARTAPMAAKASAGLAMLLIVTLGTLPSTDRTDRDSAPGPVAAPAMPAGATSRSAAIIETPSHEAASAVEESQPAPVHPRTAVAAIAGPDIEQADEPPSQTHPEVHMRSPTLAPEQPLAGALAITADDQAQSDTDDAPDGALATVPAVASETTADGQPAGASPTSTRQTVIAAHLRAGDEALQANRLTTPLDDSAYTHFSKVLELAPRHAAASAGIERIADGYLVLASKAQRKGKDRLTRVYLERGLKVRKDHAGLLALRAELESAEEIAVTELVVAPIEPSEPPPKTTLEALREREGSGNIVKDFMHVWRTVFD